MIQCLKTWQEPKSPKQESIHSLFCESGSVSRSIGSDSLWPMDCSPAGSSVHGILQARMLEWVAISFSRETSWPRDWTCVSCFSRRVLYYWTTRKAHMMLQWSLYICQNPCRIYNKEWDLRLQGLYLIIVCQWEPISCNKCTTLMQDVNNRQKGSGKEERGMWNSTFRQCYLQT